MSMQVLAEIKVQRCVCGMVCSIPWDCCLVLANCIKAAQPEKKKLLKGKHKLLKMLHFPCLDNSRCLFWLIPQHTQYAVNRFKMCVCRPRWCCSECALCWKMTVKFIESGVQTVVKAPPLLAIIANLLSSLFAWKQRLGHFGKAPLCNLFLKTAIFRGWQHLSILTDSWNKMV